MFETIGVVIEWRDRRYCTVARSRAILVTWGTSAEEEKERPLAPILFT
jgi:hypothetical protein